IWQDQAMTWTDFDAQVDAYARGLQELDLPRDEHPARVAISLPNRPEFAIAYFAVLRAGLVATPINPGYTGRELDQIIGDSGATILIGTPDVIAATNAVVTHTYRVGTEGGGLPFAQLGHDSGGRVEPETGADDLAVLLYTSGTEGTPKGA